MARATPPPPEVQVRRLLAKVQREARTLAGKMPDVAKPLDPQDYDDLTYEAERTIEHAEQVAAAIREWLG